MDEYEKPRHLRDRTEGDTYYSAVKSYSCGRHMHTVLWLRWTYLHLIIRYHKGIRLGYIVLLIIHACCFSAFESSAVSRDEVSSGARDSTWRAPPRRTSHWLSGSVMQEITTQMIRIANEKPTAKYIGQNVSNPEEYKILRTSIFGSKYYSACCARDIVERRCISITEDVWHDFNWEYTDSEIGWRS